MAALQKELQALEAARKAKADLEAKLKEIEQKRAKLDADVAAATAQRDVLKSRLQELERKNEETDQHLDETQLALGKLAKRDAWIALLPPPLGKDESDVVESLRESRQRETAAAQAKVATLTHEVQATEKALLRAAELLEKRLTLDRDAALAKTLADHLKAHELIAWIQEEALVRLAEAGSRHLQKLSQNRYTLRLGSGTEELAARAEQDFYVVDAWNGDAIRSVRTLSGERRSWRHWLWRWLLPRASQSSAPSPEPRTPSTRCSWTKASAHSTPTPSTRLSERWTRSTVATGWWAS